jgi:hypothetical protein
MSDIREILKEVELHDSTIDSVTVKGDGSVELFLDIDDVWNKDIGSNINGIRFKSVYEVSDFKIDRLNVIGSIEVEFIEGYNKEFVTHLNDEPENVSMVSFELVAGGSLNIICSGLAELIRGQA